MNVLTRTLIVLACTTTVFMVSYHTTGLSYLDQIFGVLLFGSILVHNLVEIYKEIS